MNNRVHDATCESGAPAIDLATVPELLAASARSRDEGRHVDGAAEAEDVLGRLGITAAEQAGARELLSLHRLRLGDYEASVRHGLLALEYVTAAGDELAQSKVHCTLALAFADSGLHEPALRHVLGALETARASGSQLAEFWALSRSSMVHEGMGHALRAMELGRQALALSRSLDDPEVRFAGLNNLGDTCLDLARFRRSQGTDASSALQEALGYLHEAVGLAHGQGHTFREAIACTTLVGVLVELGRFAEARGSADRSRRLAAAHGYRNLEIDNEIQLAEVLWAEGRIDEATARMNAQLSNELVDDDVMLLTRLHRGLYEMHKAAGRFERALAHHEQLHELQLRLTVQTAGLQSRMLVNTLEIEQARHETERSQLETQMQRIRAEKLDRQAHTDPLTHLPNRRALDRQLPTLMRRAVDQERPLCAAMIDLDHFKRVNDEFGHATGDRVLAAMARILSAAIRDSDLAVRVGGEEFLLVIGDVTPEQAALACDRLLAAVRDHPWGTLGAGLNCTVSIGLAVQQPEERVAHWLARADASLYAAKRAGRDCLVQAP